MFGPATVPGSVAGVFWSASDALSACGYELCVAYNSCVYGCFCWADGSTSIGLYFSNPVRLVRVAPPLRLGFSRLLQCDGVAVSGENVFMSNISADPYGDISSEVTPVCSLLPPPPSPPPFPSPPSPPPTPPSPSPPPPEPPGVPSPFSCCTGQVNCGGVDNDPPTCAALAAFYVSTVGPAWLNNSGWADAAAGLPTDYCASFYGVTCDDSSALMALSLPSNGLAGSLPAGLARLSELQTLELSSNGLHGELGALSGLDSLQVLRLEYNSFTGGADVLGSLLSLSFVYLNDNQLSSTLPDSLSSCVSLLDLELLRNAFSGTIPASWGGNLTQLLYLDISANFLVGSIPESLYSMTSMLELDLYGNSLTGSLSAAIGNMSAITWLDISSNRLSGSLPDSMGSLTALTNLYIYSNLFSGSLPASLGSLSNLQFLDANTNRLSGSLSDSLVGLLTPSLSVLRLDSNSLSGTVPSWLGSFSGASLSLGLSNNEFQNGVPAVMLEYPFSTRFIPCDTFTNSSCTYLNSTDGLNYIPVQPTVVNVPGAFISACPAGSFTSGAITSGQGSLVFPAPACAACALGTVAPSPGATHCTLCPANTFAHGDGIACDACPANSVSAAGSLAASNCSCTPGYASAAGACSPCAAGSAYTYAGSSGGCVACVAGSYTAAAGAFTCTPCPANTYGGAGASSCFSCPPGSTAASGASSVWDCVCAYAAYQRPIGPSETAVSFDCAPCPPGAACSGKGLPLALAGYWHEPNVTTAFYDCLDGFCLAETPAPATQRRLLGAGDSNCRTGHTGIVCGACLTGWALQGQFCAPCPANSAFADWPRAKLGGVVFISVFLFFTGTTLFLLGPIIRPRLKLARAWAGLRDGVTRRLKLTPSPPSAASAVFSHLSATAAFTLVPARIVLENLQIISSFKRTMRLGWPRIFDRVISRLNFLNLSLLTLPSTACTTPNPSYLNTFQSITTSIAGFLVYMCLLWALGRSLARRKGWKEEAVTGFDRLMLRRVITFLTITYAPVTEITLSIFSCRTIGDASYIRSDTNQRCLYGDYHYYRNAGIFWICFYVVGVPLFYLSMMTWYGVPAIARQEKDNARLRALLEYAFRRHIPQPDVSFLTVTTANISVEHVATLHREIVERGRFTLKARTTMRGAFSAGVHRLTTRTLQRTSSGQEPSARCRTRRRAFARSATRRPSSSSSSSRWRCGSRRTCRWRPTTTPSTAPPSGCCCAPSGCCRS